MSSFVEGNESFLATAGRGQSWGCETSSFVEGDESGFLMGRKVDKMGSDFWRSGGGFVLWGKSSRISHRPSGSERKSKGWATLRMPGLPIALQTPGYAAGVWERPTSDKTVIRGLFPNAFEGSACVPVSGMKWGHFRLSPLFPLYFLYFVFLYFGGRSRLRLVRRETKSHRAGSLLPTPSAPLRAGAGAKNAQGRGTLFRDGSNENLGHPPMSFELRARRLCLPPANLDRGSCGT
jgi:hypothetical protein